MANYESLLSTRTKTGARTVHTRPRPKTVYSARPRTFKMSLKTGQGQGLTSLVEVEFELDR